MALIITPGQFARRAEFYHQLAQLTAAGLGLVAALQQLERSPPDRSYREPIRRLLANLADGSTLTEGIQQPGEWLPQFDIALLNAGEQSGRLDSCFRLLAEYYADRARVARQMLGDLAYPAFLLHFAVFIFPFAKAFSSGHWVMYFVQTFGVLIPLYAVIAVGIYAAQSKHGERWRAIVEKVLHPIPLLGSGRRYLALARLATALEALLSAGVTIIEAWELAASASGSPALRRVVFGWRRQVDGGVTPAEVVRASGFFPDLFVTQYTTGEVSGQLDDTLNRLHRYFHEEGSRRLRAVAQWTPRGVYLIIALVIAYNIVSFWAGYFREVGKAAGW